MNKNKFFVSALVVLIYLGIFLLFYFWSTPIDYLTELTKNNTLLGPLAFTFLAFLVVVVAPLTIVPLIPVASVIFGPFWAGLYTIIGWFFGGLVDFVIARKFGKPLIKKFISLETIEKYEDYIPRQMEFWWIVILRIVVQVDILSYALGLFSRVSFWKYALATLVGMTPMAFIISYAGQALLMKNFEIFAILAFIFMMIFVGLSYFYYRKGGVREEIREEKFYEKNNYS